jgi:hypothetical protein
MDTRPAARVIGNSGLYFVATLGGTAAIGTPSPEIAAWTTLIGLIASTSRELAEYGKGRKQR